MRYAVTTQPQSLPIEVQSLILRLNLDDSATVRSVLTEMLAEAVSYAENKMECSLMPRTITAVYFSDELRNGSTFELPQGPVVGNPAVQLNGVGIGYRQSAVGNSDRIIIGSLNVLDNDMLTVVYEAGYPTLADIPADILGNIRMDTATRYMVRELHSERPVNHVRDLDAFYQSRARVCPIA